MLGHGRVTRSRTKAAQQAWDNQLPLTLPLPVNPPSENHNSEQRVISEVSTMAASHPPSLDDYVFEGHGRDDDRFESATIRSLESVLSLHKLWKLIQPRRLVNSEDNLMTIYAKIFVTLVDSPNANYDHQIGFGFVTNFWTSIVSHISSSNLLPDQRDKWLQLDIVATLRTLDGCKHKFGGYKPDGAIGVGDIDTHVKPTIWTWIFEVKLVYMTSMLHFKRKQKRLLDTVHSGLSSPRDSSADFERSGESSLSEEERRMTNQMTLLKVPQTPRNAQGSLEEQPRSQIPPPKLTDASIETHCKLVENVYKIALTQTIWYLSASSRLCGTRLAVATVNTSYCRLLKLEVNIFQKEAITLIEGHESLVDGHFLTPELLLDNSHQFWNLGFPNDFFAFDDPEDFNVEGKEHEANIEGRRRFFHFCQLGLRLSAELAESSPWEDILQRTDINSAVPLHRLTVPSTEYIRPPEFGFPMNDSNVNAANTWRRHQHEQDRRSRSPSPITSRPGSAAGNLSDATALPFGSPPNLDAPLSPPEGVSNPSLDEENVPLYENIDTTSEPERESERGYTLTALEEGRMEELYDSGILEPFDVRTYDDFNYSSGQFIDDGLFDVDYDTMDPGQLTSPLHRATSAPGSRALSPVFTSLTPIKLDSALPMQRHATSPIFLNRPTKQNSSITQRHMLERDIRSVSKSPAGKREAKGMIVSKAGQDNPSNSSANRSPRPVNVNITAATTDALQVQGSEKPGKKPSLATREISMEESIDLRKECFDMTDIIAFAKSLESERVLLVSPQVIDKIVTDLELGCDVDNSDYLEKLMEDRLKKEWTLKSSFHKN